MDTQFCLDCKRSTQVAFDHSAGDAICFECGLVLEDHYIEEKFEWRTFSDQDPQDDPSRVGQRSNPLLDNGVLTVNISKDNLKKKAVSDAFPAARSHGINIHGLNPERSLIRAFQLLDVMADGLNILAAITDLAKELYKKADDQKFCRGRNSDAVTAACLFLACQEKGVPRTLKEIATVANGSSRKEINKMKELLKKILEVDSKTIHADDLSRRCCSRLGMSHQDMKAVSETLKKLEELDVRRNPKSVLAAVVYMIAQLSNDKLTVQDVSEKVDVAVGTTKKTYKDLYPYASRILPSWYVKSEEDLKKLCIP